MKTTILAVLIFFAGACLAQERFKLQKVAFGGVFATSASAKFPVEAKPFALGYNLSFILCNGTNKSYHNFLYGFGNNTIKMVNGYLLRKDLGLYNIIQKNLSSKGGYISLGIEKFVKAGDMNFFLFSEIGTNIKPATPVLTLGVHANIQTPIWRRK